MLKFFYIKIISQLDLPNPGDDLMFSCWDKITNENSEINSLIRNTLIVPCVNTSNIYYISISEQLELAVSKVNYYLFFYLKKFNY